jgi:MFS family permease
VFFVAYAFSCMMSGISTPLFNMLIANTTTRPIGAFFGAYNLVGAISGIFASWVLKQCERWFVFPVNFRTIFLLGVVSAIIASLVLSVGIKEVRAPVSGDRIRAKDLPGFFRKVWRENHSYKRFVCTRMIMAAAEFSIPFFIVKAATFESISVGYLGTASLVLLITKLASSKLLGFISDRFGSMTVLAISCVCGITASTLVLIVKHYFWIIPLFVLVGFIQNGIHVAESVTIISHSDGRNTTVYTALNGILVTPVYILASFVGGILAERFSMDLVFVISTLVFLAVFIRLLISELRMRNLMAS